MISPIRDRYLSQRSLSLTINDRSPQLIAKVR
jgi:hypothetical protein